MRRFTLIIALLLGCGHTTATTRPLHNPAAPPEKVGPGMPVFDTQHNWTIVKTHDVDEDTVAVVTLMRPEMAGMMRLEIIRSNGLTIAEITSQMRAATGQTGTMVTGDPASPPTADIDGYRWHDVMRDSQGDVMYGTVLIRRIPGHTDVVALCEGWWPETSEDFLRSPLHAACMSVRPFP